MSEVRPEIEGVVTDFVERLETHGIHAQRVYLFGSYLNGTADRWSDVDLIVVSKDFTRLDYWDLLTVLSESERDTFRATGKMVEPHAKTPEELATCHPASFLADVLKDAVVVYDAKVSEELVSAPVHGS